MICLIFGMSDITMTPTSIRYPPVKAISQISTYVSALPPPPHITNVKRTVDYPLFIRPHAVREKRLWKYLFFYSSLSLNTLLHEGVDNEVVQKDYVIYVIHDWEQLGLSQLIYTGGLMNLLGRDHAPWHTMMVQFCLWFAI